MVVEEEEYLLVDNAIHQDLNTMDYITIATAGNAIDFGDLKQNAIEVHPVHHQLVEYFQVESGGSPA